MFKPRKVEGAETSEAFIEAIAAVAQQKIAEQRYGSKLTNVGYYKDLAERVNKPGRGLDLLLTKLRGMNFTKFDIIQYKDRTYLTGQTKPLVGDLAISRIIGLKTRVPYVEVPEGYIVAIPTNIFFGAGKNGIHLLPTANLTAEQRHFHHLGMGEGHPFERETAWCWDEFSTITSQQIIQMNISGLFNTMFRFASTHGDHWLYRDVYARPAHYPIREPLDTEEVQKYARRIGDAQ